MRSGVRDQPRVSTSHHPLGEVVAFVAAAYLGSWLVGGIGFVVLDLGEVGLAGGVLMVPVAALLLTHREEGNVVSLVERIVQWRVPIGWYGVAVVLPLAAVVLAVALASVVFGGGPGGDPVGWVTLLMLPLYVLLLGGPEEVGWRGYALPRLQARIDALGSSLVVGAIWIGWHIPVFIFPSELFDAVPFLPYAAMALSSSVVYTWLYNSARGSVLLAMILHGSMNLSLMWVDSTAAWYLLAAVWTVIAVGLTARYGRTNLSYRARQQR